MEARYPVSQPRVSRLEPSRVVFRLPPTLPVQTPTRGVARDPYIANPPISILRKDEITNRGFPLRGLVQLPYIAGLPAVKLMQAEVTNQGTVRSIQQLIAIQGLSRIFRADVISIAPSPPIFSIRGITQSIAAVGPSELVTIPIADIVSQVILQGLTQLPFLVDPSKLIAFIAPSVIPPSPAIFAIRNILASLDPLLPPSLVKLPTAEIISNITLRGLRQDLLQVGLPSIYNPIAEITSNAVLKGLIQDIARVGNPTILATIAEIVKQGFIKGLPQDLILVGPSELVLPAPIEIVSSAVLQGIIQGRLLVEPSKIVKPAAQTGIVFLTGITRSCPALTPLGGVTVLAFRTSDNTIVGSSVSDGGGNYSIQVVPGIAHYLVAYLPNAPDVFGTTRNDLFGT